MKKIFFILSVSIFLITSCNQNELPTFDPVKGQTYAKFESSTLDLPVTIDATGEASINVIVSTKSDVDRVATIEINKDATTAASENYQIPSFKITIPAGQHMGSATIKGIDNSVDINAEKVVLKLVSIDGGIVDSQELNVNIFQVCPVDITAFTGKYLIKEITPYVDGPTLQDGDVITITALSETQRVFETANYVNYCSTPNPFKFTLVCNQVIVADNKSNCHCDGNLYFINPPVPGTYDATDDSQFTLSFINDAYSDCGSPVITTYTFTKTCWI